MNEAPASCPSSVAGAGSCTRVILDGRAAGATKDGRGLLETDTLSQSIGPNIERRLDLLVVLRRLPHTLPSTVVVILTD